MTTEPSIDLTACDREPIHIPEAIQPHGLLLVVDKGTTKVLRVAGDVERRLGIGHWEGQPLASLIGVDLAERAAGAASAMAPLLLDQLTTPTGERLDVSAHPSGSMLIVEFEPAPSHARPASAALAELESAAERFQRTETVQTLCDLAAKEFRKLTGFDRVMIYRFLEDNAGCVVSEDRGDGLRSFLNHHFPATDIPRQARALYVRNPVRVIPAVDYQPAILRPAAISESLDMSDCTLRSVSPVHLQYLRNMEVAASASISILIDGRLWGLIACHHRSTRGLPNDVRSTCRVLAGILAQQIKAKEEAEGYRERLRLASFESGVIRVLSRDGSLRDGLSNHLDEVRRMLRGDGIAVLRSGELLTAGACPDAGDLTPLADWLVERRKSVFSTDRLPTLYPPAERFQAHGSGVLAIVVSFDESWVVMWFRAEQVEVVNWAGNPHKTTSNDPEIALTPRSSFDAWRETVRGRSRRWTLPEVETAARLRSAVLEARQNRRIRDLNRRLAETLRDKDVLLEQKQYLIGEVSHRVQNSLQLVSGFLSLQGRASADDGLKSALDEANRRVRAVALMHRRLYRGEQMETIDVARYIDDLSADAIAAMGKEWADNISLDLAPIMIRADRAAALGLVFTELLINANKYAYGGGVGPIAVRLSEAGDRFQLSVADTGGGRTSARRGFGSRMIQAMVTQLGGDLVYADNNPGLRATLTAPTESARSD